MNDETRSNMMKPKRKELAKARNPFVQHLINKRGSGVHEKSKKVQRRDDKMALKQNHEPEATVGW